LKYDTSKDVMYCNCCREKLANDQSPFVIGTNVFKLESIKFHEKSSVHIRARLSYMAKEAPPSTSQAEKAIDALNKAQVEKGCHVVVKLGS
jgi:hypothetical protein